MATVVFVHGTGVRRERYLVQFERIRANLALSRPDVEVRPCLWGDELGASLRAGGVSMPGRPTVAGSTEERRAEADWVISLWRLLDADPLHELRMITPAGPGPLAVSRDPAALGPDLAGRSQRLLDDAGLRADLAELALLDDFEDAVAEVLKSRAAQEALAAATDVTPVLARAYVAEALRRAALRPQGPVPLVASRRDELLRRITDLLGGGDLGVVASVAKNAAMLAWRGLGAGLLERRRGAILDGTHAMAGDILLYLSRGERIRDFIRACCADAEPPIVLLAHSLGGIASLDLLIGDQLPGVRQLITVGSQAPLLYELDALPSLAYGRPLPETVPEWINVYDPRDLLAYVGEPLFPGRVRDVSLPGGNAFPAAHGDYFGNPAFYHYLEQVLP